MAVSLAPGKGPGRRAAPVVEPRTLWHRGYNAVAYFTQGRRKKPGGSDFPQATGPGVLRAGNRTLLPRSRAIRPQYDGYCAWAMIEARRAKQTRGLENRRREAVTQLQPVRRRKRSADNPATSGRRTKTGCGLIDDLTAGIPVNQIPMGDERGNVVRQDAEMMQIAASAPAALTISAADRALNPGP